MVKRNGDTTGHAAANACCAKHAACLTALVERWAERIKAAQTVEEICGCLYKAEEALIEEVIRTPCERLSSGETANGSASKDAQINWLACDCEVEYCEVCGEGYCGHSAGCSHIGVLHGEY